MEPLPIASPPKPTRPHALEFRARICLSAFSNAQEPGLPTPGQPSAIRPPIASNNGAGILTCFPSATHLCLALGADSPYADERCVGNLGLTARGLFTPFIATHVSIRTSDTSSSTFQCTFAGLRNALLPCEINLASAASVIA